MNLGFGVVNKGIAVGIGVGIAIIFVVVAFATNQISPDENGALENPLDSQESDVQTTPTTEPGKTFTLELSDGAGTTDGNP